MYKVTGRIKKIAPQVLIKQPMHINCKAAVLIPALNEDIEMLLRPLVSLAEQKKVQPEEFEIIFVINNNKNDARKKSKIFLTNQKALKFLNFLNVQKEKYPPQYKKYKKQILKIQHSGIYIRVIDKSSLHNADKINNVGSARSSGSLEICRRFSTINKEDSGIIIITDCDCRFSSNYVEKIINDFKKYKLNALCGRVDLEFSENLPHKELVEKAVKIHLSRGIKIKHKKSGIIFQKHGKIPKPLLKSGANIAVGVSAYLKSGGFEPVSSFEDTDFGLRVCGLLGECAKDFSYTIFVLARPSSRAGGASLGRRVEKIIKAVKNYKLGKSGKKLFVPDLMVAKLFFLTLKKNIAQRGINLTEFISLLKEFGFNPSKFQEKELRYLLDSTTKHVELHKFSSNDRKNEHLALTAFYEHLPEFDAALLLEKELDKQ